MIADYLLQEGNKINFTATDDSHFTTPDCGGGWVMVAAELDQNAIIQALKDGQHYSSSGAAIYDIAIEGDSLLVHCDSARSIIISGAGHTALSAHGNNMTKARFDISALHSKWFRVSILRKDGAMAWSNPYWKKDIAELS